MQITVNTQKDCCQSVDINCTPTEWLIVHKALKRLSEDEEVHPSDRKAASDMYNVEPQFYEMEYGSMI